MIDVMGSCKYTITIYDDSSGKFYLRAHPSRVAVEPSRAYQDDKTWKSTHFLKLAIILLNWTKLQAHSGSSNDL